MVVIRTSFAVVCWSLVYILYVYNILKLVFFDLMLLLIYKRWNNRSR